MTGFVQFLASLVGGVGVMSLFGWGAAAAWADDNRADDLLPTDTDGESVEQFADRELRQFDCPHLDADEVQRLREVARRQAAEVVR